MDTVKENDKIRKQFKNVKSYSTFPRFTNQEWDELEKLITNYKFINDNQHQSGEVIFKDYHITFEIKETEKTITEKYLLLSCKEENEQK